MSSRSEHYREKGRRSTSPRERRSEDWRNVKVKDEPVSDAEGGRSRDREGSRRLQGRVNSDEERYSERSRSDRDRSNRDRYSDYSGRDRERSNRRSRSRDRDDTRARSRSHRDDRRPIKSEPRSRSRSRSPPSRGEFVRPQARRHHNDDEAAIKVERGDRSRSRSPPSRDAFVRPETRRPHHDESDSRRDRRNVDNRGGGGRGRGSGRSDFRPREPKREQDWDNFFNPNSEMSQQAMVKREQNQVERAERIRDAGSGGEDGEKDKNVEKEKPNFGLSGKLTEETNTYRGVVIKYSEPPEARKPIKTRWRLYPFKDGEALEVMYVHRQSAYLLGRERKIADIPIDHPSCSKQHAVIQYRLVPYERPDGSKGRRIKPYIIDLESANGTFVNGAKIDPKRYVELFEKDVLKFGFSSREYVLLHEHSKDNPIDDDETGERSPSPE